MTCPSPDYCGVNGCSNAACHPSRPDYRWAAVPARPELYETPRGIGRAVLAAAAVALVGVVVLAALAVLLS